MFLLRIPRDGQQWVEDMDRWALDSPMTCAHWLINIFDLHYHQQDKHKIYVYQTFKLCLPLLFKNTPKSIIFRRWMQYGSSKGVETPSFFWILSDDESRRETGLFLFQNWCHFNEQTHTMDLYPPALGTIPFGYWVSRVLGPSSKARDGFGLYT